MHFAEATTRARGFSDIVDDSSNTVVVLLSGLWTPAWAMILLQRRMERAGLRCVRFGYASTRVDLEENSRRLASFVRSLHAPRIHIVGHSLGGVVALHAVAAHSLAQVSRIVMMGSPYVDSVAARRLARWRFGRWMLGKSIPTWLACHRPHPPQGAEVGVIAGTLPLGLGMLIAPGMVRPHDGVVRVDETRFPGMVAHVELRVSHIGMAFSARVADHIVRFLRYGRFDAAAAAEPAKGAGTDYALSQRREP